MRNGVDGDLFRPVDRAAARQRLGLDGPLVISVGNLLPNKGNHLTLTALVRLPGLRFALVGDGPERRRLEALARDLGLADRVHFVGRVAHERLGDYYSAADVVTLASEQEGWPNVLLESMACGTPVVATDIPGPREIVTAPEAGLLVERNPEAIAKGIRALLGAPPDRGATRAYAERHGWEPTTRGQIDLFRRVLAGRAR